MTKKVIQVLNHFLPYQTAGTEVYTWALSRSLQKLGWTVVVVVPNFGNEESDEYEYDGIRVIRYPENSGETREINQGKKAPIGLRFFQDILQNEKPEIVHFHEFVHGSGIGIRHVQSAKKMGAKVMMTFHLANYTCETGTLVYKGQTLCDGLIRGFRCAVCSLHDKGVGKMSFLFAGASLFFKKFNVEPISWNNRLGTALSGVQQIERLKLEIDILFQNCDYLVSLTDWYREILIKNNAPKHKIHLIRQALPFEKSTKNIAQPKDGVLKLMFLGRISSFKGVHTLIDAVMQLDAQLVSLDIYGQETEKDYVFALKEKSKLCKNIHWRGLLQQNEVITEMQKHDVLCLCSTFSEMSPLVIQEAFEARIPVIASDVYGNREQIRPGTNGLLFKFRDVTSLRDQIFKLILQPDLLLHMQNNILPPDTFDCIAEQYDNLYCNKT